MRTSSLRFVIYLFLIVFCLIGLLCGFLYFNKDDVPETFTINNDLRDVIQNNTTSLPNDMKRGGVVLLSSLIFVLVPYSLVHLFYFAFSIGFVFHFLLSYGFIFSFLYIFIYYLIPLFFLVTLFKNGLMISKNILLLLFRKKQVIFIKKIIIKFFLIYLLLLIYDAIILVFSGLINRFLLSLI